MNPYVRKTGYYCNVCDTNFNPDPEDIEDYRSKEWTDKKIEQKIDKEYEKAKESFYDHWEDEHW